MEIGRVVLIGASTGGPGQIESIIKALVLLRYTSIIIAQHMASDFLGSFAKRLSQHSKNSVRIIEDKMVFETGYIYVAQGVVRLLEEREGLVFYLSPPKENHFNPDINSVFSAFSPYAKRFQILGVILTGIGDDGVQGCKELALHGARMLTQTAQSAIVDGMPARARQEVDGIEVLSTDEIKNKIAEFCN
ncbi:MAG: CheB methylesterase domain-containing protein [Sulfurimonas sp.]|uniref:CheB methylesterase domain-containing protein n=1 Tax=Sulfurimonas sp. TaxID=2022749 RepID=UPI0026088B9A|nr:CheB methylesterase domain-containing protein [Sulfurimonas sp.]MDD2652875.1 CheB methylesterase domain-containing protein [Sulfurimonas sp.]MDD3452321.1 CheB methylesterase domain-containing protein [Sulfurimonas sp.]